MSPARALENWRYSILVLSCEHALNSVSEQKDQLEEAREEANRKVQDTSQFRQMKSLMQSQSSKIRDLR